MKRSFLILLLFFIISAVLSGCQKNNEPVIGCIAYSDDNDFLNGVNLCYNEYSESEKSNIRLSVKQIKLDEDINIAFNQLKEDGADIIISNLENGKNTFADNDGSIPVISAKDYTTKEDYLYFFGLSPETEAQYLSDFIINDLKLRTAAVMINVDYDYSSQLSESFQKYFTENNGEITGEFSYRNTVTDFTEYVTNFSAGSPQVLLIFDEGEKTAALIEQAYNITPILPTFIGSSQWIGIENFVKDNTSVDGAYYLDSFSEDISEPEVQLFLKNYKEKYENEPTKNSALGYDMTAAAFKTFINANNIDSDSIVDALKYININGVSGSFQLSGTNEVKRSVYVNTIINGEKVLYMQK